MFLIPQKFWCGLIRRAEYRKDCKTPPPRGKHWRAKAKSQEPHNEPVTKSESNLKFVTKFVDTSTDFKSLMSENFGGDFDQKMA